MICNEIRYFKLNRILLLALGLWPYQQPAKARLQVMLIFGIIMISVISQFRMFVTAKCTANFVVKVLSIALCNIICGVQYISFWINMKTVKCSLDYVRHMCHELKDENEIAIIESYGHKTKRYTTVLTLFGSFYVFALAAESMGQSIKVYLLINESHSHHVLLMVTDYLANQKKDLCLILLHTNVTNCIALFVTLATGTMLVGYLQYTCGMFTIASYRVKQAVNITHISRYDITPKNEVIIRRKIIYAVNIHRKAIEFSKFLITKFEGTFFFMIFLIVPSLCFNLYCVFQIVIFGEEDEQLLWHVVYFSVNFLYMFLSNYFGQEVTDHYNDVFITAYNVPWYVTPLSIQKLIILLLQRGNKTYAINIGGLFSASLECFATLTSATMSYFTVMYSTQH